MVTVRESTHVKRAAEVSELLHEGLNIPPGLNMPSKTSVSRENPTNIRTNVSC